MQDLSARYPVWFCDIWGVVHNGVAHFPAAADALARHRANGGTVLLVTNAPRLHDSVARQLGALGVRADACDGVVTSGDVTRKLISAYDGKGIYHLGPARDEGIFRGLDAARVSLAEAAAVVCTGLFDDSTEGPDDYAEVYRRMLARRLPMICANPDKIVRRGDTIIYCSGALAERYAALGGEVLMAGKPFAPIYALARAQARRIRGRDDAVLCIGDGPETDIKGAADNGFDVLLVAGGISDAGKPAAETETEVRTLVPHARIVRTLEALAWPD
jgi:HAD superfamily hydrolase (TIGR01459 family)